MNIAITSSGISVVLIRKREHGSEVLLLKRSTSVLNGEWCYIGGGIEEGEKAWEAALREVEEETGVTALDLYVSNTFDQFYRPHQNDIYLAPVFVGFVKEDQQIELNHEHSDYRWLSFTEAKKRVCLPGNDAILSFIEKHFINKTPNPLLCITS
ncbi:NTP pyrophosphohydrolase including oxidative damage repair enzymes [Bacillus sp. JCM 19046]|nr:NTP pyrophosphohydrolase including oxidative damage repair enzymes [Bacillus sp. JCM 19045]GAF19955.1 NTP pyrophosphohydrolase including oxidative damage repair enzymes [Bacillus sp. JCM 19046]